MIRRIEVDFAIPVELSDEDNQALHQLLSAIVRKNQPLRECRPGAAMSAYSARWGVLLGLAYVLLSLFFLAGFAVGGYERNVAEAERISRGYGVRR